MRSFGAWPCTARDPPQTLARRTEPTCLSSTNTPPLCRRLTSIAPRSMQPPCHPAPDPPNPPSDLPTQVQAREDSSFGGDGPQTLRKLPAGLPGGHDGRAVARSGDRGGKGGGRNGHASGRSKADREALERALSDVKPLNPGSKKRVMPALASGSAPLPWSSGSAMQPAPPLILEREANGIVLGRRRATHSSILEALEHPKLEVQAQCDLHGQTAREAEREVLRFVRECQRKGQRWVLIIVGKGLHSPGGQATLKSSVADALSKRAPSRFVLAFRTAPRHLGGTGALVARLVDRL